MKHSRNGRVFTDIVLETFKLGGLLVTAGDELSDEFGLTSARWKVLGALANSDSPITVSQIAASMGQTRQGVQRLSNEMVGEGVLVYQENPHHKKAQWVAMTAKGKKLYKALMEKQAPWANEISAGIDAQEIEVALEVLRKIAQKLSDK